jgi:hypothetical protein
MGSANEILTWKVHPANERRGAALVAVLVIFALAYLTYALMNSLWWGVFAVVVLGGGLNRFFLPSRFTIDADGVTAHYPWKRLRYRWSEIRRFLHDSQSGYISRRRRPSFLDHYSGIHLLFAGNRAEVVERIKRGIAEAAESQDGSPHAPREECSNAGDVPDATASSRGSVTATEVATAHSPQEAR